MNMTHRARGCPFITNVDGEDFVIDGFAKYKGYGDECKTIYFAGVAIFQDVEKKLVFPFCFEYSYDTDEYRCYSDHFSDEIVENDFAYFIVENYERSCKKVKEVRRGYSTAKPQFENTLNSFVETFSRQIFLI